MKPVFLSDTLHRKKSVGRHLYSLAILAKKRSQVDNILAKKLKTACGYILFDIRQLDCSQDRSLILKKAIAPLEHQFNNHTNCDESWCRVLHPKEEGKVYSPPTHVPFFCKKVNSEIYK